MRPIWLMILAAALWLPLQALAAAGDGASALQHFYHNTGIVQGHFVQLQYDDAGQLLKRSEGDFLIARPSRFRWDYRKPYRQTLVSDGQTFRFYDVDLAQVTVRPLKLALQGTPIQLLIRGGNLASSFNVKDAGQRDGLNWVVLTPKSKDADFSKVKMGLSGNLPREMLLSDRLGQSVHIIFTQLQTPASVPDSRFQLDLPDNVEIVDAVPNSAKSGAAKAK